MKKFQFHMQKLLSYKEQTLDSELMNLAVLNGLLRREIEKLNQLKSEQAKHKEEFELKIRNQITPAAYRMYDSYAQYLVENIRMCEEEIALIEDQIEKQIGRVKELKIETKSLETIKEHRYEEYKKENIKKNERLMDEFVSRGRIVEKSQIG
ncbi:MAG TPA: flagellar export protein FliJ [Anaerovoracaceae bacterium]|nr:flagellar export protein FliJ [Anaerovoracaceae bacterium]